MNAAVLHAFGEAPRFERFPDPVPGDGEALVCVRAAGLHPIVRSLAGGDHYAGGGALPAVPGVDCAGVLADGTRVYAAGSRPPYGTMAELTVVPAARCVRLPDEVDDATAAALCNPGVAAWIALSWRGRGKSPRSTRVRTSCSEGPEKGVVPVSSAYRVAPRP